MFEIRQKVVCVKTHPQGHVKEGEVYVVKDLRLCAKCKRLQIDVGVRNYSYGIFRCTKCSHGEKDNGICWLGDFRFKPIDDLYNEELSAELEEIFSKQPFEL